MGLAVLFGAFICSLGLAASYTPDLPASATIVIIAAVLYPAILVARQGYLAAQRRRTMAD